MRPIDLPLPATASTADITNKPAPGSQNWKLTRWQQRARTVLLKGLSSLRDGQMTLCDADTEFTAGHQNPERCQHPLGLIPRVEVQILEPKFYTDLIVGGSMAAAEGYIRGWWRTNDLPNMLRLMLRNEAITDVIDAGQSKAKKWSRHLLHWLQRNTLQNSRKNIVAHYDLGNDFYQLMLDPTMTYSAGLFANANTTLEQSQLAKYDRLCQQLQLKSSDHLLEIGTGWGGMAMYAAKQYGCRVTTTTISPAQFEYAQQQIAAAGLTQQVTLLQQDYRQLTGVYDKLVSVEMLEAVGHQFYETFFAKCGELLKPGGKFALQTITIEDQRFLSYQSTVDFIQKYVFPGGCLPSLTVLTAAMTKSSRLRVTELADFGLDYARTLVEWRQRFFANLDAIRALGYPEPFLRLWEYYLAYCEAGFRERTTSLLQMVIE